LEVLGATKRDQLDDHRAELVYLQSCKGSFGVELLTKEDILPSFIHSADLFRNYESIGRRIWGYLFLLQSPRSPAAGNMNFCANVGGIGHPGMLFVPHTTSQNSFVPHSLSSDGLFSKNYS
jgi:hypothetical protein